MNICKYIIDNNIDHIKLSNGKIKQKVALHLEDNNITSLDGFVQDGLLNLRNNKITSLEGFLQNRYLVLCKWRISIQNNNLIKIGCKTNSVEEWDIFFENKESYETDPNSYDYKEIERIFKLYKTLIK